MKLKAIIPLLLIVLIGVYLSLGNEPSKSSSLNAVKTVAITQIIDHPSLNEARKGVIAALHDVGYVEGKNLKLSYETPNGNLSVGAQIAAKLNHQRPNVIVSISTTSSQMVLAANSNHNSLVFSSVTDPIAANLITNIEKPGGDITGTMESPPIEELLTLIIELLPQTKTIGIIYNSSEANSIKTVQNIKSSTNLAIIEAPVTNAVDVKQAMDALSTKVDVLVLPSDNTVWSALELLTHVSKQHNIPVFTNDPDSVYKGVTLALGYSQYSVGYDAGTKVGKILNGEDPGTIPVSTPPKKSLYINAKMAKALNLKLPEHLLNNAEVIVKDEGKS